MPQFFGSESEYISKVSLWVEADYLDDVNEHERALADAGFNAGDVPVNINKSGFHPRGQMWGQHLRSDPGKTGNHHWMIVRVANPGTDPNGKEFGIGGSAPRYAAEIHAVPKGSTGRGSVTPVWTGNNVKEFTHGPGRPDAGMTWPTVKSLMQAGPRRA